MYDARYLAAVTVCIVICMQACNTVQSEDCNHSTEVCLNSKEVLKASLEAAERQVLELRCSLDEASSKFHLSH